MQGGGRERGGGGGGGEEGGRKRWREGERYRERGREEGVYSIQVSKNHTK